MTVIEIRKAIQRLSKEELNSLVLWIAEYKNKIWDLEIEEDYNSGKLNGIIESALTDIYNGNMKAI